MTLFFQKHPSYFPFWSLEEKRLGPAPLVEMYGVYTKKDLEKLVAIPQSLFIFFPICPHIVPDGDASSFMCVDRDEQSK